MNVLVATDGSKYGRWALNWAAKLPFVKRPSVMALHVIDSAALRWPFKTRLESQRLEARAARTLKRAKQLLVSLKLKGTARKEQGAVASVILKHAPNQDGLLVVGSKGLDALDRFLLGSVSAKLIEHAICPMLVVKGDAVPLRRIILATDGSSESTKALAFVLTKLQPDHLNGEGRRGPIHVNVVHVRMPSPLAPITAKSTIPWIKYPGLKEVGSKLVEQSTEKLIKAGFTAEPLRPLGRPAEEIIKAASKQQADLIVMGAKGLGAIDRFLLGSVSTRVVQHIVRNPQFPRHRSARFPRGSDRLGLECIGKLTSRCCWHADLQFHDSPTYGSVYEIRGGSVHLWASLSGYSNEQPFRHGVM